MTLASESIGVADNARHGQVPLGMFENQHHQNQFSMSNQSFSNLNNNMGTMQFGQMSPEQEDFMMNAQLQARKQ